MEGSKLIDLSPFVDTMSALLECNDNDHHQFAFGILDEFMQSFKKLRALLFTSVQNYVKQYQSIRVIDYNEENSLVDVTTDAEYAAAYNSAVSRYLSIIEVANKVYMLASLLPDGIYNSLVQDMEIAEYYTLISQLGTKICGSTPEIRSWAEAHKWVARNS